MLHASDLQRFYLSVGIWSFWLLVWGLTFFYFFRIRMKQDEKDAINAGHDKSGSVILSSRIREWYFDKIRPFEEFFIARRMTPNHLTICGFCFSLAAAYFYHIGWIGFAGWMVVSSGTFDIFDGLVARKTNQVTKSGAFFDSVLDRYAEMIVYMGILSHALRTHNTALLWTVVFATMGAQMVSYTRARAEAVGVTGKVGIMQRPERYVFLGFGSFFSSYLNGLFGLWIKSQHYIFFGVVAFIALMSNITAYRRLQTGFQALKEAH